MDLICLEKRMKYRSLQIMSKYYNNLPNFRCTTQLLCTPWKSETLWKYTPLRCKYLLYKLWCVFNHPVSVSWGVNTVNAIKTKSFQFYLCRFLWRTSFYKEGHQSIWQKWTFLECFCAYICENWIRTGTTSHKTSCNACFLVILKTKSHRNFHLK